MPAPRVAPPAVFPDVSRAPKPPADSPSVDAYRQTTFVLGDEVAALLEGLRIEAAVALASSGSKFRKQTTAAVLAYWSRSWLSRLEAVHALDWGNYTAALSLVRVATRQASVTIGLARSVAPGWVEWMERGAITLSPDDHAVSFAPDPLDFEAVTAHAPEMANLSDAVVRLSRLDPPATLFLVGADSDATRTLVTFGDRGFHLGFAELLIGWLLEMSGAHLLVAGEAGVLAAAPDKALTWTKEKDRLLARADRCRGEMQTIDAVQRLLIANWRRQPGNVPRKVVI